MTFNDYFTVGKYDIGYISSTFLKEFDGKEFERKDLGTYQKLPRYMSDTEIESELKPGICELGDVLAFFENPPEGTKDGYFNIFYFKEFVVTVFWYSDDRYWYVDAWYRDSYWYSDNRVFSPASRSATESSTLGSSDTLSSDIQKAIETVKSAGYQVSKIL